MSTNAPWQVLWTGCTFGIIAAAPFCCEVQRGRVKSETRREIYLPQFEADDLQNRDTAESACQDGWHSRGLSQPDRKRKPGARRCTAPSYCRRASLRSRLALRAGEGCELPHIDPRRSSSFLTLVYRDPVVALVSCCAGFCRNCGLWEGSMRAQISPLLPLQSCCFI
jgi:hypothetical protein